VNGCNALLADCIRDRVRPAIPQAAEWQRIGNQINSAFIFAHKASCARLYSCIAALDCEGGQPGLPMHTTMTESLKLHECGQLFIRLHNEAQRFVPGQMLKFEL
jgi:hypothetical protein